MRGVAEGPAENRADPVFSFYNPGCLDNSAIPGSSLVPGKAVYFRLDVLRCDVLALYFLVHVIWLVSAGPREERVSC